jgi:hypothetical protein
MGALKQLGSSIINGLREQPLALTLLVINAIFLMALSYVLHEVSDGIARKDAMIERCLAK